VEEVVALYSCGLAGCRGELREWSRDKAIIPNLQLIQVPHVMARLHLIVSPGAEDLNVRKYEWTERNQEGCI
jgi:hypothetical protein